MMKQPRHILETGLSSCFDSQGREMDCRGSGQDAEFKLGLKSGKDRFQVQDETVLDALTGLVWPVQADIFTFPLPWGETLDAVRDLNGQGFLGFDDWRLPNRRELRSLICHGTRKPALPPGHPFEKVFLGWYWTSTTSAMAPAYAWHVHMEGGRMFYGDKQQPAMGWPVRGTGQVLPRTGQKRCFDAAGRAVDCQGHGQGQDGSLRMGAPWPEPRFAEHEHGMLDRMTGLIWAREADLSGLLDWQGALDVVAALNRDAGGGWRLPNINELESLVDASVCDPALPEDHPFTEVREAYWSSTTSFFETGWAYCLYLHKGAVGVGYKSKREFHCWPVQGPV